MTSVGMFPGWRGKRREFNVAFENNETLSCDGQYLRSATYEEWLRSAIDAHADVHTSSLLEWRYYDDALRDPRAKCFGKKSRVDRNPVPASIHWRVGQHHVTLREGKDWNILCPGDDFAVELAAAGERLGVGIYNSPASLGLAVMRRECEGRHTMPPSACCRDLKQHFVGGRIEDGIEQAFDATKKLTIRSAHSQDRRMSHCAEAERDLPIGTAIRLPPGVTIEDADLDYAAWWGLCTIVVSRALPLGPFPFRAPSGKIIWPTKPGTYEHVPLWSLQAQDCRTLGVDVQFEQGWGWEKMEPILAKFARTMFAARMSAESPGEAQIIKMATEAAIGFHAMDPIRYRIVHRDQLPEDHPNWILNEHGIPTDYGWIAERDPKPTSMTHWASYIWMQSARALFWREYEEIFAGNEILAADCDELITRYPSTLPLNGDELGGWRGKELGPSLMPASRQLISAVRIKLPGVERMSAPELIRKHWMLAMKKTKTEEDQEQMDILEQILATFAHGKERRERVA